ncbi:dihydrolipoamide acetyltransferase family protein [Rhodovulum euryhalinum]|uniref:Dihydrolipoamide acetyltransferase component of pyruvate dehydrogenase complex n=1 Tax=Rhodovulum euryhalinum TaxID=35805 RepID=A0A4R2KFI9_9RHOB|nr:dihydrolipoamide acetyltransferase family protein [Rhodovulum euryhalinum]TCO72343.1 pyruvate dehydrogenase E2 component (dihydrolipoamide acetyltransferase) [Rhodovulum euryhalinum]
MGVFTMPSLGADMEAGRLTEWLVAPGETVKRGDIVAVVETQKGAIEIEIFEEGTVERLMAEVGQSLPVGAPLALIRGAGEAAPEAPSEPAAPASAPAAAPDPARPGPASKAVPATGIAASPAAKALAAARGIDLGALTGTGPGRAIVLADVEAAGAKPADPRAEMRKAIAAAMAKSKREIPHYYLFHRIDLQAATDWLAATNAARPPEERLLMGALIARATALAAHASAGVNGHFIADGFRQAGSVHLGIAVALRGGGLIAPAIRDAHLLPLDAMMAALRDMVARARAGRLRSSELTDGTITLSSLGETGVEAMAGIIYPPQVALVAVGAPTPEPVAQGRQVSVRQTVTVSLAADHRASDGRIGAKFLAGIDRHLQHPEDL